MNIIHFDNFKPELLKVFKPKRLSNKLIIFPLKYNKRSFLLKTPFLTFPKGIQQSNFSNQQYITFLFPDIFTNKHIVRIKK